MVKENIIQPPEKNTVNLSHTILSKYLKGRC